MSGLEKVVKGLECCAGTGMCFDGCPYYCEVPQSNEECTSQLAADALKLLKEQGKEIKALRLLVEWAEECDFGFDQFPDEYERYKDEIKGMKYIDGMIHVAKRTLQEAEPQTVLFRDDGEYCPRCSTITSRVIGVQKLHRGTRFCPYCGKAVTWNG